MKNRLFGMLLLVCSVLIAFSSCKDDGEEAEATLKLDPVSVALLKGQPDSVKVKVMTNQKDWKATRPDADSWCTLVPEGSDLWVKAEANPDTVYRETRLTFSAGSMTEYLTIKQLGTGKAQILVNPQALELNVAGEVQPVVFVVSEGDKVVLPAEKVDGWCTVALDPENANGLLISADMNKLAQKRVAKVAIAAGFGKGMATDTIVVTQQGAAPAKTTFSPMEVLLTDVGTAVKVKVTTNQSDFSFKAPTGTDNWCTVVRNGNELTISGTKNENESGRLVKIAFETGNTENLGRDTLVVIQQAKAKSYQLWETYYYNGKPAGIVYQVSEDGMHGMILSIDELSIKDGDTQATNGQTTLYTEGPLGLDNETDGMVNYQKALEIDPTLENFPPFKWCANKNTGGESGWYIPSIVELDMLYFTLFGIHSSWGQSFLYPSEKPEWNPESAKAFQAKLALIEGSDTFVTSGEEHENASLGYYGYGSSTESMETITDPDTEVSQTSYVFNLIMFNTDESPTWMPGYFSGRVLKNFYKELNPELLESFSGNELFYMSDGQLQRYRAVKRF